MKDEGKMDQIKPLSITPTILIVGENSPVLQETIDVEYPYHYSIVRAANLEDALQSLFLTTPQEMHSVWLSMESEDNERFIQTVENWSIKGSQLRQNMTIVIASAFFAEVQYHQYKADAWLDTFPYKHDAICTIMKRYERVSPPAPVMSPMTQVVQLV